MEEEALADLVFSLNCLAALAMVFPKSYIVFVVCRIGIGFASGMYCKYVSYILKCIYKQHCPRKFGS